MSLPLHPPPLVRTIGSQVDFDWLWEHRERLSLQGIVNESFFSYEDTQEAAARLRRAAMGLRTSHLHELAKERDKRGLCSGYVTGRLKARQPRCLPGCSAL